MNLLFFLRDLSLGRKGCILNGEGRKKALDYAFQMASSGQIKVFSLVFQATSRQETERRETEK